MAKKSCPYPADIGRLERAFYKAGWEAAKHGTRAYVQKCIAQIHTRYAALHYNTSVVAYDEAWVRGAEDWFDAETREQERCNRVRALEEVNQI